jgi:hypothetical protein
MTAGTGPLLWGRSVPSIVRWRNALDRPRRGAPRRVRLYWLFWIWWQRRSLLCDCLVARGIDCDARRFDGGGSNELRIEQLVDIVGRVLVELRMHADPVRAERVRIETRRVRGPRRLPDGLQRRRRVCREYVHAVRAAGDVRELLPDRSRAAAGVHRPLPKGSLLLDVHQWADRRRLRGRHVPTRLRLRQHAAASERLRVVARSVLSRLLRERALRGFADDAQLGSRRSSEVSSRPWARALFPSALRLARAASPNAPAGSRGRPRKIDRRFRRA